MPSGLYIHVPFCIHRCIYCAFYLEELGSGPIADRLGRSVDRPGYVEALARELEGLPSGFTPETVYVGGGTPTELSLGDLRQMMALLGRRMDASVIREYTVEANPGTLNREKAELLLASGVNRVSLGLQAMDNATLDFLSRVHRVEEALATYRMLRECGFANINVDLIICIPGRGDEQLNRELDQLIALEPDHVSCYGLEFDAGAPLTDLLEQGHFTAMEEDVAAGQYELSVDRLEAAGLHQYEISNFSRPGFESRHNLNYWNAGEYLGCGPSASSHVAGRRYKNLPDLKGWQAHLAAGESPIVEEEQLPAEAKARESLMLALRQKAGITTSELKQRTGFDLVQLLGGAIQDWIDHGYMEWAGEHLRLTRAGMLASDALFVDIVAAPETTSGRRVPRHH
ncbi:MAG: radical SAM family heme chaperone HemW [Verrucomicrobiota bacterium]|jgi:oxygen-independent coproporphyrinogen-3 oxidase